MPSHMLTAMIMIQNAMFERIQVYMLIVSVSEVLPACDGYDPADTVSLRQ